MKFLYPFISCLMLFTALSCKKNIKTIRPEFQTITESVYASGIVKSKNQFQLFANINGIIKDIKVNEGSIVKKGDILFIIENSAAELNTENAALNAVYNDFNNNQIKLNQLANDIQVAKKKLKSDSLFMSRQNNLWNQGIGTKADQEQRELNYQSNKLNLENLILKYEDAKKQLKFLSEQSKKNLKISQKQLGDFIVKSGSNGRIYALLKEAGEMVSTQTPIAVIGDESSFVLELQLDEFDITKIKEGQEVIIRMDSYQNQVFEGKVDHIDPLMNEKTRTFTVEASFLKLPDVLYPNLTLEANIVLAKKKQALTIPTKYLVDSEYVMLKDGTKRRVKTGLKDYQLVEITEGIDTTSELIMLK